MSNVPATTTVKKTKSFWDTKEGTTGMVFGMAALGFVGWGAYKLMPYIANLLENTFYATLFGLLTVGLVYVTIIDGTLRNRMWLVYKLMMRALTYSIISYDPIGVLREIGKQAWERIQEIDKSRKVVAGQVQQVQNALESALEDQQKLMNEVNYWQSPERDLATEQLKRDAKQKANIAASKFGRLGDSIKRLTKARDNTQMFYDKLTEAHSTVTYIRENIDFEINVVEREYKATNAAHGAWVAVRQALKGTGDMDDLQNETLAFLAEDYGQKLGEIGSFMSDAQPFIDNVDLQKAMHAEDGMRQIEALNARTFGVVESRVLENNPSPVIQQSIISPVGRIDYAAVRKINKE
jgi:hypothetical protein